MWVVLPWDHQHLVGVGAPERAKDDDVLVGKNDAVPRGFLGLDRRAQETAALEAGKA